MSDDSGSAMAQALSDTKSFFESVDIQALPPSWYYWKETYITPMQRDFGIENAGEFFVKYLRKAILASREPARLCSIGSGDCAHEVAVAKALKELHLDFTLECLELSPILLDRGRAAAETAGVANELHFIEGDINEWKPATTYTGFMACHSLHHVINLEGLFDGIKASLDSGGLFVAVDMIGRNGHLRWPEALEHVNRFWRELPRSYRYNMLLSRLEETYENWDCSTVAFEGIRAQDILPKLTERFDFPIFLGFGNVIDVFVDRPFGHHFDPTKAWDRDFLDRVHAVDEAGFASGELTPTQMMAVLSPVAVKEHHFGRGLAPGSSIRKPD